MSSNKRLLLHTCCGPCLFYPLTELVQQHFDITCLFFNPNIHPYLEYERRFEAFLQVSASFSVKTRHEGGYGLTTWLKQVMSSFPACDYPARCAECYRMRIEFTVQKAKKAGFDCFSTTLLYSRYQQHEVIRLLCQELGEKYGILFVYQDFRAGWQQGIDMAVKSGVYRQSYCGCIFSEAERYAKRAAKLLKIGENNADR